MTNWIFLRGLGRASPHWGHFPSQFAKVFPEDQAEYLDLAGNGTEAHRSSFTSIADNVDDLRQRSKFIAASEQVNLVCISLGAMVGASWAEQFPQEISSLTLINSSDKSTGHLYERLRPKQWLRIPQLLLRNNDAEIREQEILKMTTGPAFVSTEWAKTFALVTPTSRSNWLRQLFAAHQFSFPRAKPTMPIQIVSGAKDQLVDPACSQRLALMWNASHFIHPDAGHDLPLMEPEWLCERLKDFQQSFVTRTF